MEHRLPATPAMARTFSELFVNRRAYTIQSTRPHTESGRHYYYRPKGQNGAPAPGLTFETICRHLSGESSVISSSTVVMPAEGELAPAALPPANPADGDGDGLLAPATDLLALPASSSAAATPFADDTGNIDIGDRVLLIVENDINFVNVLVDMAHENNFKALVAPRGATAPCRRRGRSVRASPCTWRRWTRPGSPRSPAAPSTPPSSARWGSARSSPCPWWPVPRRWGP